MQLGSKAFTLPCVLIAMPLQFDQGRTIIKLRHNKIPINCTSIYEPVFVMLSPHAAVSGYVVRNNYNWKCFARQLVGWWGVVTIKTSLKAGTKKHFSF